MNNNVTWLIINNYVTQIINLKKKYVINNILLFNKNAVTLSIWHPCFRYHIDLFFVSILCKTQNKCQLIKKIVFDYVEKRNTKNLFLWLVFDLWVGPKRFIIRVKIFLTQLVGQTRVIKQIICHFFLYFPIKKLLATFLDSFC